MYRTSSFVIIFIFSKSFGRGADNEPLNVDTFSDRNLDTDFSDLRKKAVQALQRLLGDDSKLKELWEENEELNPAWRQGVEQFIVRLNK